MNWRTEENETNRIKQNEIKLDSSIKLDKIKNDKKKEKTRKK